MRWITLTEIDTVGFRVLREGMNRDRAIELVTEVPAAGSALEGHTYAVLDDAPEAARAWRYYLEDVDVYGKVTRHGPFVVQRGTRQAVPARDAARH